MISTGSLSVMVTRKMKIINRKKKIIKKTYKCEKGIDKSCKKSNYL